MRLAALLLCLALPASAQQVVDVQRATLLDSVGRTHAVQGGVWMDDAATLAIARELARSEAENAALRAAPAPSWPWWLALGVGLAGGVALGVALR